MKIHIDYFAKCSRVKKKLVIAGVVMSCIGSFSACGYEGIEKADSVSNVQDSSCESADIEFEHPVAADEVYLDEEQVEEAAYDDLVKDFYLDSGELCPVEPFNIDRERTGGCDIVFDNGLHICLPESWEDQVTVEPYMRGIRVKAKSGGELLDISFPSKEVTKGNTRQLFPWEALMGVYEEQDNEYAIIYEPVIAYPITLENEKSKSEYLKLYDDIEKVQILTEAMSGIEN